MRAILKKNPGARAAGKAITLEDQLPKGKREASDDAPPRPRGPHPAIPPFLLAYAPLLC